MARIFLAALAAALVLAAPARAAVSTTFANGTLTVTMTGSGDVATLKVEGQAIHVNGAAHPNATTVNTNSISFQDTSGTGSTTAVVDLGGGGFAPGQTDEAGTSDEIEFFASLGQGTDEFVIRAAALGDAIRMGSSGINFNPEEADGADADMTTSGLQGVETVRYDGGTGPDVVHAAGGGADVGTTPFTVALKLNGGAGDDELTGGNTGDTVNGEDGNDTLVGSSGDDTINGGEGNDRLEGQVGNDTLDGGNGDDTQLGAEGNDTLHNSAGNDSLDGGSETVFITGDVLSHVNFYNANPGAGGLRIDLGTGAPQDTGAAGMDSFSGLEDILGSAFADVLKGTDGGNLISGGDGDDVIESRNGQDRIFGGPGADRLAPGGADAQDTVSGDDGVDFVDYSARATPITVQLGAPGGQDGTGGTGETAHVLKSIEGVIGGSAGDTLAGSTGDDYIEGGPGQDQLQGGAGGDRILSREGTPDAVDCGLGNDTYDADPVDDVGPSCERPDRIGGGGLPPAGLQAPALGITIGKRVKVRRGAFAFKAFCRRESINRCQGTAIAVRGRKRVGLTRFEIPLGANRTVRVRLNRSARRLLARRRSMAIRLIVSSRDDGGRAPSRTFKLTLRR